MSTFQVAIGRTIDTLRPIFVSYNYRISDPALYDSPLPFHIFKSFNNYSTRLVAIAFKLKANGIRTEVIKPLIN